MLRESLKEGLTSCVENQSVDFGVEVVAECTEILDTYLRAIQLATSRPEAMTVVKGTVLRLNELNDRYDGDLIETDERELIAGFIIKAGELLGFNGENEDVTEEWREW
jgi:hypothetical protein